jgi:hypothetical protein
VVTNLCPTFPLVWTNAKERPSNLAALVFGRMVELAGSTLTNYHSDFYHDAMWLNRHVTEQEQDTFFWGFDEMGTCIGMDAGLVLNWRKEAYNVRIEQNGGRWEVVFTPIG